MYSGAAGVAPTACAITGKRRRRALEKFIVDGPVNQHHRFDNRMTEEDKKAFITSLKASKASDENSLVRNERDIQV